MRDQWTTTAQGALERAFGHDSSILDSFSAAQGICFTRGDSDENLREIVNQKLASEVSILQSAIQQLSWEIEGEDDIATPTEADMASTMMVFVSHSSRDVSLATALVDLLQAAIRGLHANRIRCSSVNGYGLPGGVSTAEQLRRDINGTKVFVALITPNSLLSLYVMFELGARWGAKRPLVPLLAGVEADELKEPLKLLNALSAHEEAKLHQLVQEVSVSLKMELEDSNAWLRHIGVVKERADATPRATITSMPFPDTSKLDALQSEINTLAADNFQMKEKLRIKERIHRFNGHTYIDGDDAEMCANCLAVESLPVPLQDMNLDGTGRKATCPHCRMPRGNGPPIPRKRAEETDRRIAEKSR